MAPVTARSARAAYRTRQVVKALRPRIDAKALEAAQRLLKPAEAALFVSMEKRDQRHALEVMARLIDRGVDDQALLVAALLHDCAKDVAPVWLRVAKVLAPAIVAAAGRQASPGWRGAAYRLTHHPELGARLALAAGADERTAAFIRGHVPAADEPLLALLHAADDES